GINWLSLSSCNTRNHDEHHTSELPEDQLTVRRGQAFKVTLDLAKPFKQGIDSLVLIASTGGKRDSVFLADEQERREYVLNEQGVIYRGSSNYISPLNWDFGQNPAGDLASRGDPVYVGRVISAMPRHPLHVEEQQLPDGQVRPVLGLCRRHVFRSYRRRRRLPESFFRLGPVARHVAEMRLAFPSVMRLLGIPTRVVSNFVSAHDTDASLTIDVYHADEGARRKESNDSIWNYHVWVESWMKRPDLKANGKYDGWQVLDATPQEASDGQASLRVVVLRVVFGTQLPYDVPFVFAEVNADCVDWLTKADGTDVKMSSDTKRVGKSVSTKAVGYNKRLDITRTYKHREGEYPGRVRQPRARLTRKSAAVFQARKRSGPCSGTSSYNLLRFGFLPLPSTLPLFHHTDTREMTIFFDSRVERKLNIRITVEGMHYNGTFVATIQSQVKEGTLHPFRGQTLQNIVFVFKSNLFFFFFFFPPEQTTSSRLPNLSPNNRFRVQFPFVPYRTGLKMLTADIHSSIFKDFKGSYAVNVRP
uniref:Transglutaminase-like domain-containing protein n=1 Tax=Hippocampus comes TaxID=109280 RepID=A0A3Q3DEB4_HIPCM